MAANIKNNSEANLVNSALKRLKRKNNLTVQVNVPLLGRYVDLVYFENNSLYSIEFKLNDWRRAISQAKDHRLAADYSYICMPERVISSKMMQLLIDTGIGLFFFKNKGGWPFKKIIEAKRSNEVWPVANNRLKEFLYTN